MSRPVRERLMSKVRIDASGCWVWTGALDKHGYGRIAVDGRSRKASRIAFMEMERSMDPDAYAIVCEGLRSLK